MTYGTEITTSGRVEIAIYFILLKQYFFFFFFFFFNILSVDFDAKIRRKLPMYCIK